MRRPKRQRRTLSRRIVTTCIVSVVTGCAAATAIFFAAYLAFPLNGVSVNGNEMLPDSHFEELAAGKSSLLTLNAEALERRISADPWIKTVSVSRDWAKDEAVVDVQEREPVLRATIDGDTRVYDSDGAVLPNDGEARLPAVEIERWQLDGVLSAVRVVQAGGDGFEGVDDVGAEGIRATISGRSVLLSGEVEVAQVEMLDAVFRENPDAPVFDLRSPGRVVVSSGELSTDQASQGEENPAG